MSDPAVPDSAASATDELRSGLVPADLRAALYQVLSRDTEDGLKAGTVFEFTSVETTVVDTMGARPKR